MASDEPIRIRGHHLLCMLGFRGLGYSDEFVSNMRRIVDRVMGDPDTVLELIAGCDAICEACPHQVGGYCVKSSDSKGKIGTSDAAILAHIGLAPGTRVTAREAYKAVASTISPEDIGALFCVRCGWRELGYCAEGLAKLTSP